MIEHTPRVGPNYETGLCGERIMIIGHSHYGEDSNDKTKETLKVIIDDPGEKKSFFTAIKNYFGYSSHEDFWNKVVFLNFIPSSVGEDRYHNGTQEQNELARKRFYQLIKKHKPDKIFVFSRKAWHEFPQTNEEKINGACHRLGIDYPDAFEWGTYDIEGHLIKAFGLRHPQGAKGDLMRKVVAEILAMKSH